MTRPCDKEVAKTVTPLVHWSINCSHVWRRSFSSDLMHSDSMHDDEGRTKSSFEEESVESELKEQAIHNEEFITVVLLIGSEDPLTN